VGALTGPELAALGLRLMEEQGFAPSVAVVEWLEQDVAHYRRYVAKDPEFAVRVRDALRPDERQRLPPALLEMSATSRCCGQGAPAAGDTCSAGRALL